MRDFFAKDEDGYIYCPQRSIRGELGPLMAIYEGAEKRATKCKKYNCGQFFWFFFKSADTSDRADGYFACHPSTIALLVVTVCPVSQRKRTWLRGDYEWLHWMTLLLSNIQRLQNLQNPLIKTSSPSLGVLLMISKRDSIHLWWFWKGPKGISLTIYLI